MLFKPLELFEDQFVFGRGNTSASIDDLDEDRTILPACAEEHGPAAGVLNGIGNEVLEYAAQELAVCAHPKRGRDDFQFQALLACQRCELDFQVKEKFIERYIGDFWLEPTCIQSRNIDQGAQNFFHCRERSIDVAGDDSVGLGKRTFDEARCIEPSRVEGL